jgi:hypothetical protein
MSSNAWADSIVDDVDDVLWEDAVWLRLVDESCGEELSRVGAGREATARPRAARKSGERGSS